MCEKKTVLSVILGVAIVALISSIVVVTIDGFTLLFDYNVLFKDVKGTYHNTVSILELVAVAISVVFAIAITVVSIFAKNKRIKLVFLIINVSAAIVTVVYFVITVIVLRNIIPAKAYYGIAVYSLNYSMFTAYLTNVASLTVSLVLSAVSILLLTRLKAKHSSENTEACANNTEQAENNITE